MVDEVTVRGLLAIGGMAALIFGPVAWLKVVDSFQEWRERKTPASRRLARIDWLDPELRRN